MADDVVKLAKTTVIESDVHHIRQASGLYSISNETFHDLQVVIEYESDIVIDDRNNFIAEVPETTDRPDSDTEAAMEALAKAESWKSKVLRIYKSHMRTVIVTKYCYFVLVAYNA